MARCWKKKGKTTVKFNPTTCACIGHLLRKLFYFAESSAPQTFDSANFSTPQNLWHRKLLAPQTFLLRRIFASANFSTPQNLRHSKFSTSHHCVPALQISMWRRRHLLGGINCEGLTGKGKTEYLKGTGDILVGDFGAAL